MVTLLGPADSNLRAIESSFPTLAITVRGNEISFTGDLEEAAKLEALINELLVVIRSGQALSVDSVTRSISMLRHVPQDHPAEVLSLNIVSNFQYRQQSWKNYSSKNCKSKALRRCN